MDKKDLKRIQVTTYLIRILSKGFNYEAFFSKLDIKLNVITVNFFKNAFYPAEQRPKSSFALNKIQELDSTESSLDTIDSTVKTVEPLIKVDTRSLGPGNQEENSVELSLEPDKSLAETSKEELESYEEYLIYFTCKTRRDLYFEEGTNWIYYPKFLTVPKGFSFYERDNPAYSYFFKKNASDLIAQKKELVLLFNEKGSGLVKTGNLETPESIIEEPVKKEPTMISQSSFTSPVFPNNPNTNAIYNVGSQIQVVSNSFEVYMNQLNDHVKTYTLLETQEERLQYLESNKLLFFFKLIQDSSAVYRSYLIKKGVITPKIKPVDTIEEELLPFLDKIPFDLDTLLKTEDVKNNDTNRDNISFLLDIQKNGDFVYPLIKHYYLRTKTKKKKITDLLKVLLIEYSSSGYDFNNKSLFKRLTFQDSLTELLPTSIQYKYNKKKI